MYSISKKKFDCGYGRMSKAIVDDAGEVVVMLNPSESEYDVAVSDPEALLNILNSRAELERQRDFWKQACDDAHNLGAARLGIATDTLEDVLEWIETGKVGGVGFDEQIVVEDIRASLKVLA